ncbi:MAG: GNAT family N-acetyltransferase [Sedimenticola sp.]
MAKVNLPAIDGLTCYSEQWQARNREEFGQHPLLDTRFVLPLLKYFGDGTERLLAIEEGQEFSTAVLVKNKQPGMLESFMPSQAQISSSLIKSRNEISRLMRISPFGTLALDLLGQDPAFTEVAAKSDESEAIPHLDTINIHLSNDFESYWSGRPTKLRQNVKRYIRRFESEYKHVEFREISEETDIDEAVRRYSLIEGRGWKGEIGTAISSENKQLSFYIDVLKAFAREGQANVYELLADNRVIASRLAIKSGQYIIMLKTTYDEEYSRMAPGRILLYKVVERLFETDHGKYIEFYTNATNDQKKWATGERSVTHVTHFSGHWSYRLIHSVKKIVSIRRRISAAWNIPVLAEDAEVRLCNDFECLLENLASNECVSEHESFFQGITWYKHLADTILDEKQNLRIYFNKTSTGKEESQFIALPFYSEKKKGVRVLNALSNYYTSLYGPVYSDKNNLVQGINILVKNIAAEKMLWDMVNIYPLAPEKETFQLLEKNFSKFGWVLQKYRSFGNWYLPCKGMTFDQYISERPSQLKNTLQRKRRQFDRLPGSRLEIYTDLSEVEYAVSAFNNVYERSWKRPEPYPKFIDGLARLCSERGWLRLGIAWLEDKPIAAQLWIVSGKTASIYKLAYDEDYQRLSAGTILSAYLMEYVLDVDKVAEVDYLTGDDEYKSQWMSHRRERIGLMAINPRSFWGILLILRHSGGAWIKQLLMKVKKFQISG